MTNTKTSPQTKRPLVKKRTRKWPKDKPKRPMTTYNFFFQHERNKILQSNTTGTNSSIKQQPPNHRRRGVSTGTGFGGLAKYIAAKWKTLKESEKEIFETQAAHDKRRYLAELEVWKQRQELGKMHSVSKTTSTPFVDPVSSLEHLESSRSASTMTTTTTTVVDPLFSCQYPGTLACQSLDEQIESSLYEVERSIGKVILAMFHHKKELLQKMVMNQDQTNHKVIAPVPNTTNELNNQNCVNEVQHAHYDLEPIPIPTVNMAARNRKSTATMNLSDHSLESTNMPFNFTCLEQNDSGLPSQVNENINNINLDEEFMKLLKSIED